MIIIFSYEVIGYSINGSKKPIKLQGITMEDKTVDNVTELNKYRKEKQEMLKPLFKDDDDNEYDKIEVLFTNTDNKDNDCDYYRFLNNKFKQQDEQDK